MKWLNIITQDEEFREIVYELFDSEKDLKKYSETTKTLLTIYNENKETWEKNLNKINKARSKTNKRLEDIFSIVEDEDGYIHFTLIDSKYKKEVEALEYSYIRTNRINLYLNSFFQFTEKDFELMPEIKELEYTNNRYVNSIGFQVKTSWDKLHVPEELRHSFIAAMIMNKIQEEII